MRVDWLAVIKKHLPEACATCGKKLSADSEAKYWISYGGERFLAKAVARAAYELEHGKPPGSFSSSKSWAQRLKDGGVPIEWRDEPAVAKPAS